MISVLIPVYNFNVTKLVKQLLNQFSNLDIDYEIICIDDASTHFEKKNIELDLLDNVAFSVLKSNVGRSKIRNILAKKAKFDWLLFLDSDAFPTSKNFISNYIASISKNKQVINGGVVYNETIPEKDSILRWLVGKEREEVAIKGKMNTPCKYFFSANFIIHKKVFSSILFDENLTKYGYEDYLFSQKILSEGFEIQHIDNAILHLEDEETLLYLEKVKEALSNLLYLFNSGKLVNSEIRILNFYLRLKKFGFRFLLRLGHKFFKKNMESNLKKVNPSLFIFDIYRLSYLSILDK